MTGGPRPTRAPPLRGELGLGVGEVTLARWGVSTCLVLQPVRDAPQHPSSRLLRRLRRAGPDAGKKRGGSAAAAHQPEAQTAELPFQPSSPPADFRCCAVPAPHNPGPLAQFGQCLAFHRFNVQTYLVLKYATSFRTWAEMRCLARYSFMALIPSARAVPATP